jgi:hypothetical protein
MILSIIAVAICFLCIILVFIRLNYDNLRLQKLSIVDLAEFSNLSKEMKDFYKAFILEKWIVALNESLNGSIEISGLDNYYINNKEKLIILNNIYLDIAKSNFKQVEGDVFNDKFKLLLYNTDLDKLINDAEKIRDEMNPIK